MRSTMAVCVAVVLWAGGACLASEGAWKPCPSAAGESNPAGTQPDEELARLLDRRDRIARALDNLKAQAASLPRQINILQRHYEQQKRDLDRAFREDLPTALLSSFVAQNGIKLRGLEARLGNIENDIRRATQDLQTVNNEINRRRK